MNEDLFFSEWCHFFQGSISRVLSSLEITRCKAFQKVGASDHNSSGVECR